MPSLLDRLIAQLNTLVPFLAMGRDEVYELLKQHHAVWFSPDEQAAIPDTFEHHKTQVAHGAFVLGYSYSEAFLADLIHAVYRCRPEMLPRDKQLKFGDVLERDTYDELVDHLIRKEVMDLFYNNMQKVVDYFGSRLKLPFPEGDIGPIIGASLIRNCIIHNNSRADSKLAGTGKYSVGEQIRLTASDVHSFGIAARSMARTLYSQANAKFTLEPAT